MLPGTPDQPGSSFSGHVHPTQTPYISEKEEIARAALRSLGGPNLPAPSSSYSSMRSSFPLHGAAQPIFQTELERASNLARQASVRAEPSYSFLGGSGVQPPPALPIIGVDHPRSSLLSGAPAANESDSYFGLPSLTQSPSGSPRLDHSARTVLESDHQSPYLRDPPSLSVSSSASTPLYDSIPSPEAHEAALRRIASSLRLSYDDVRCISHTLRSAPGSRAAASSSQIAQRLDPTTVQRVVDALRADEERPHQTGAFRDAYLHHEKTRDRIDLRPPPPPGQIWASDRPAHERRGPSRQRHPQNFGSSSSNASSSSSSSSSSRTRDTWDYRRRSHDAFSEHARSPPLVAEHFTLNLTGSISPRSSVETGDAGLTPSPRSGSPSPFAFDPLRRPSLPPISSMTIHDSSSSSERSSLDSNAAVSSPRQRWHSHGGLDPAVSPSRARRNARHGAARKGRSIDDYLDPLSSSRQARRVSRPHDASAGAASDLEGPSLASSRHPYQPYPPVSSRNPNHPLQLMQTQSWSPSASPALIDSPMHTYTGPPSRRSLMATGGPSNGISPIPARGAAPSFAGGFGPSTLTGGHEWGSYGARTEAGGDVLALRPAESGAALMRRRDPSQGSASVLVKVEGLPLEEPAARRVGAHSSPSIRAGKQTATTPDPASQRAASEMPPVAESLSRSEILQKLQQKVKARIAAKGQDSAESADLGTLPAKAAVSASAASRSAKAAVGRAAQAPIEANATPVEHERSTSDIDAGLHAVG